MHTFVGESHAIAAVLRSPQNAVGAVRAARKRQKGWFRKMCWACGAADGVCRPAVLADGQALFHGAELDKWMRRLWRRPGVSWRLEGAEVSGLLQEQQFSGRNNRRVDIAVAAVLMVRGFPLDCAQGCIGPWGYVTVSATLPRLPRIIGLCFAEVDLVLFYASAHICHVVPPSRPVS